jgi:hypothetical protein
MQPSSSPSFLLSPREKIEKETEFLYSEMEPPHFPPFLDAQSGGKN